MEHYIQGSNFPGFFQFRTLMRYLKVMIWLFNVTLGIWMIVEWYELTPCFQRQGTVLVVALFYLTSNAWSKFSLLIDLGLYLLLYFLTETENKRTLLAYSECLTPDSILTKIIYGGYRFFFEFYLSVLLVMTLMIVVFYLQKACYEAILARMTENDSEVANEV